MKRLILAVLTVGLLGAMIVPAVAEEHDLKSPTGVSKYFTKMQLNGG